MTDQPTTPNTELLEKLAAKEHERWASWQNYLHSFLSWNNELQAWVLPHEWKDRWQSQVNTPYAMLSEKEKQSDRDQVMRYWPLIQTQLSEARKGYVPDDLVENVSLIKTAVHAAKSKLKLNKGPQIDKAIAHLDLVLELADTNLEIAAGRPSNKLYTATELAQAEQRGVERAVTEIASAKTEGLFDNGDLFIKREPIDQVVINLVGYEKFKAIRESLPEAQLNPQKPRGRKYDRKIRKSCTASTHRQPREARGQGKTC